jgi:malate/lactate dehydrogenase
MVVSTQLPVLQQIRDISIQRLTYTSPEGLRDGLTSADIVLITAGCIALKPGMSRHLIFEISASLISSRAEMCTEVCADAFIAIVTNPVNSMVPLFLERLRSKGVANPERRVFG